MGNPNQAVLRCLRSKLNEVTAEINLGSLLSALQQDNTEKVIIPPLIAISTKYVTQREHFASDKQYFEGGLG